MSESLFLVTEPAITGQDDRDPEQAQWVAPSWDEIVRAHSGRVYRLAYRLTGNQHITQRKPNLGNKIRL